MFDFVGKKKIWYTIAACIIIVGIISLCVQGLNFNIDFTGGNITQIQFAEPVKMDQVREVVSGHVDSVPSIQNTGDNEYLIRTTTMSEEQSSAMLKDIRAQLGEIEITRNDAIGPVIGSELRTNALLAIIVAVILMLAYIAFRFKFNYGLASIIAQVFDVMVVISIFSLFRLEINSAFIATILTVVGYSINNTIVIFDRVRENIRKDRSLISGDLINKSIKQTLTRTINTVVAVLILLFCLMILGGETTKIFTFGIIVGVLAGFFSSVFLTGNFLNDLNNRKNKKEQLQKNIQQKNIQNETQAAQKTVKKKKIKSKKVKSVEAKS